MEQQLDLGMPNCSVRGSRLRVVADRAPVLRTLRFAGMDTVFRVHPTPAAALAGLAR